MVTDKLQELAKYQRKVAKLEKAVARQNRKLLALPGRFGFRSMDDLIEQQKLAAKVSGGGGAAKRGGGNKARRRRAKITPEMKQKLKSLVGEGKTGAEVAEQLGISLPSVANIKRELGLVKKRR